MIRSGRHSRPEGRRHSFSLCLFPSGGHPPEQELVRQTELLYRFPPTDGILTTLYAACQETGTVLLYGSASPGAVDTDRCRTSSQRRSVRASTAPGRAIDCESSSLFAVGYSFSGRIVSDPTRKEEYILWDVSFLPCRRLSVRGHHRRSDPLRRPERGRRERRSIPSFSRFQRCSPAGCTSESGLLHLSAGYTEHISCICNPYVLHI